MTNSWVSVSAGTTTADFNHTSGLNSLTNDFYTLWLEENYKRFYRRDFLQVMGSRDLTNGLNLNVTLDYSDNSALSNHSNYSFIDHKGKVIQPNVPINNTLDRGKLQTTRLLPTGWFWNIRPNTGIAFKTTLKFMLKANSQPIR